MLQTEMDGKIYENLFTTKGDEWRKRRNVISPAFSARKMKLVSLLKYPFPILCIIMFIKFHMLSNILTYTVNAPSPLQIEPHIKESTSRLAEKISAFAENGETVEALQSVTKQIVCSCYACYPVCAVKPCLVDAPEQWSPP